MDTGFFRPAPQGLLRSRGHCVTGTTAQRQYDALRAFWDRTLFCPYLNMRKKFLGLSPKSKKCPQQVVSTTESRHHENT